MARRAASARWIQERFGAFDFASLGLPGGRGRRPWAGLTRDRLVELMRAIARSAPGGRSFRVYLVGGGTAVHSGWRESTIDAGLYADDPDVLLDVQRIKERLSINIEFARPEDFVLLAKVVRGFDRDVKDADSLVSTGLVDPERFRALVEEVPEAA